MRTILISSALFFQFISANSQQLSQSQMQYVDDYFKRYGYSFIIACSHMTCDRESIQVYFSETAPEFTVQVNYVDFFGAHFHCSYRFRVQDRLFALSGYQCNSNDSYKCFNACNENLDVAKKLIAIYVKNHPPKQTQNAGDQVTARIQQLMGIALENMTCQQLCEGFLLIDWIDLHYYSHFPSE